MKTFVGDIVLVEITVPVDVHAAVAPLHRQHTVPAVVTAILDTGTEDLHIGCTTIATAEQDTVIFSDIALYDSQDAGRQTENSMPVFAYLRPGNTPKLDDENAPASDES